MGSSESNDSSNKSFLLELISSTREKVSEISGSANENRALLCRSFSENYGQPVQKATNCARSMWRRYRRERPGVMIAAGAFTAAVVSIPFGRWAFIRNTSLATAVGAAFVSPELLAEVFDKSKVETLPQDEDSE